MVFDSNASMRMIIVCLLVFSRKKTLRRRFGNTVETRAQSFSRMVSTLRFMKVFDPKFEPNDFTFQEHNILVAESTRI